MFLDGVLLLLIDTFSCQQDNDTWNLIYHQTPCHFTPSVFLFKSLLLLKLQKVFLNLYFISLSHPIAQSYWNSWSFPCHHLIQTMLPNVCVTAKSCCWFHWFIPFCLNLFTSLYPLFILLLVHTFYSNSFYTLSQRPSFLNNTVDMSSSSNPSLTP